VPCTIDERICATIEGDFVVFLIGARLNKWWKLHKFIPVGKAMKRMIEELRANPDHGLLHVESWGGNPSIMVQYWRSFEHLDRYASNKSAEHLPAWADFNRLIGSNGDIGIWHETYLLQAGQYECIYNNMPEFGLAKAASWVPAKGSWKSAKERLGMVNTPEHHTLDSSRL
jgi:hypothetical protein